MYTIFVVNYLMNCLEKCSLLTMDFGLDRGIRFTAWFSILT